MAKVSSAEVTEKLYLFDKNICNSIVGLDEAGRGPLAGPVVAAAVILDMGNPIQRINDSKKLKPEVREELYGYITEKAVGWAVGIASVEEIDRINILQASLLAMRRALESIKSPWKIALIDGNKMIPGIEPDLQKTVVGGDARSASIGAASIIAKVTRDKMMMEYNDKYPVYEFNINKGYATESHRASILKHGLCEIHRRTFCENLTAYQTELPF